VKEQTLMNLLQVGPNEGRNEKLIVALEVTQLKVKEKELWRKAYLMEKKRRQELQREKKKFLETQKQEIKKKEVRQPPVERIPTVEELLATGGVSRCSSCEYRSYIKRSSIIRTEKLQGCQRGECKDYRGRRGVHSPFKDYDWPLAEPGRKRTEDRLCTAFHTGQGCVNGNECGLRHGKVDGYNRCYVCGQFGHRSRYCDKPMGWRTGKYGPPPEVTRRSEGQETQRPEVKNQWMTEEKKGKRVKGYGKPIWHHMKTTIVKDQISTMTT